MSRGPFERGLVISKVINPVNPRDLPSELIAALKECTIELEYLESGETYLFKTFKTGDNLDIRYKAEFEEGWYNLFEAYVAWWNEHNPADIYLIPEMAKPFMPNLGFKIISVDNDKGIENLSKDSIEILKDYQVELFKFQPIGYTRNFYIGPDSMTIRAELGQSPHKNLYEAYKGWCEEAQEAYYLTGEEIIEKRKENEMQFTISKKQIEKRISELEELLSAQMAEITKDLEAKKAAIAEGAPISNIVIGTQVVNDLTGHINYLKTLVVAENITCSEDEKAIIFRDFTIDECCSVNRAE